MNTFSIPTKFLISSGIKWGVKLLLINSLLAPLIFNSLALVKIDLMFWITESMVILLLFSLPCLVASVVLSLLIGKTSFRKYGIISGIFIGVIVTLIGIIAFYLAFWRPFETTLYAGKSFFRESIISILFVFFLEVVLFGWAGHRLSKSQTISRITKDQ